MIIYDIIEKKLICLYAKLSVMQMGNEIKDSENILSDSEIYEKERRLKRAEEVAGFGSWELYLDSGKVNASDGAKKIYGIKGENLTIKQIQELPLPEFRTSLDKAIDDLVKKQVPYNIEFQIKRFDNDEIKDIHSIAEYDPLRNSVLGIIQDITDLKKSKNALQASESLFKAILKATPDGISITDLNGNVTMVSESALKFFGVDTEEYFLGRNIGEFLNQDDRDRALNNISLMFQGIFNGPEEYKLKRPDGTLLNGEINADFIKDINGNPQGIVFVHREISQRKKIEEALHDSEEIFTRFMENSPIYVFFKDSELRSLKLSRNYEKMLGKPLDTMLGKTMYELFPSEFAKAMVEDDKRILKEGRQIEIEEEFNGRQYTTIKFPIYKDGKPLFLAGYTIDVTEKHRDASALKDKASELERFNNLMLGREIRMVELKKEVNQLLVQSGGKEKYKVHE